MYTHRKIFKSRKNLFAIYSQHISQSSLKKLQTATAAAYTLTKCTYEYSNLIQTCSVCIVFICMNTFSLVMIFINESKQDE